jgi:FMN phosphatase YigB (HAD superfamily)
MQHNKSDKTKKQLSLLLVDFDGVLSNGRFYYVPDQIRKEIGKAASEIIFSRENADLVDGWMRGEYHFKDVHDEVERQAGIDARLLDRILEESIGHMPLNPSLLRFVATLRSQGVVVSLFTNNMDIFDVISVRQHRLREHFDYIYSSSLHGQLKLENEVLLRKAASEAGAPLDTVVLVDDSPQSFTRATDYGVATFLYDQYEASQPAFETWLKRGYTW